MPTRILIHRNGQLEQVEADRIGEVGQRLVLVDRDRRRERTAMGMPSADQCNRANRRAGCCAGRDGRCWPLQSSQGDALMPNRTEQITEWWAGLTPEAQAQARESASGPLDPQTLNPWKPMASAWRPAPGLCRAAPGVDFYLPEDVADFILAQESPSPSQLGAIRVVLNGQPASFY